MAQKKHTPEQIIRKLREVEVAQGRGKTTPQAVKQIGVSEQTFYRWRKEYGGMRVDQAKRLKKLEKENLRLKRLVADLITRLSSVFVLDNQILKEVERRETSKPGETATSCRACLFEAGRLRASGLPGLGSGTFHPAS